MQSVTLIIDKRVELSTKYKKLLESKTNFVIISRDLITSINIIREQEPDLIIISDSIDTDLSSFCKNIRALVYNMRPVIVGMSKSADFNDRIKVLTNGADDFLSEPVNSEEFKARMLAHLRREEESGCSFAPSKKYCLRAIKRKISQINKWAMLYISIENFSAYKQLYTELASDKLLKTFCTILKASLEEGDFYGQIDENKFLITTTIVKAEQLARFLTFAFESVSSKFYSEQDIERGYLILQGDEFAGKRSDYVRITTSVITNEFEDYTNSEQVINKLVNLNKMAQIPNQSNFLIERPKIKGENSIIENIINKNVIIYEPDEALSILLNTILKLQGYETQVLQNYNINDIQKVPALIIIDAGDLEKKNGLNLCVHIKQQDKFKKTKIIVTSIIHDKELVLNTGADLYLPKPYEIPILIKWIDSLINEFNA